MAGKLKTTHEMFLRDARAIRQALKEIERQVGFFERNGWGDQIRFLLIAGDIRGLSQIAERARRRYEQEYEQRQHETHPS